MKFLDYLQEEYFLRIGDTEIWKNPSSSELIKLVNEFSRFRHLLVRWAVVPETKNVYVWNSNTDCFHWKLADDAKLDFNRKNAIFGYGDCKEGKIFISRKDDYRYGDNDDTIFSEKELAWLKSLKTFVWNIKEESKVYDKYNKGNIKWD